LIRVVGADRGVGRRGGSAEAGEEQGESRGERGGERHDDALRQRISLPSCLLLIR
jgi:hypothetical protein